MRRTIIAAAILFPLAGYLACKPNHPSPTDEQAPKVIRSFPLALVSDPAPETHADTSQNRSPWWCAAVKWPEWLLVVAAFLTLGAIWRQAGEMKNATIEMGRSTRAIERQADALINAERAWVMVEAGPAPGWGTKVHRVIGTSGAATTTSVPIRIICRNEGKAPAWITEKRICVKILNGSPNPVPDLESIQTREYEPESVAIGRDAIPWDVTPSCDGREDMGQMTIIYGVVIYRDTFSEGHTTTFGYRLTIDNQLRRIEKLPKYNENS